MGRLTSAVHWWEESQMRVLVLTSLVIQFLLFIFTILRNRGMPGLIRSVMWLAYLGGDAIAVYALATLFNRHKDQDRGGKNTLEVVWAPILLLHLGGPDGITAYNIEDNELWTRHLLTAVSQVTVAIYVFCKSWPPGADRRLLKASILLFIPGVLKCFAKPWALKRASITSLVSSPAAKRTPKGKDQAGETDPHSSLKKYVEGATDFVKGNEAKQGKQDEDEMDPFEEYVRRPRDFAVGEQEDEVGAGARRERQQILRGEAHKLFVDFSSPPYPDRRRLSIFKYFWVLISQKKPEMAAYGYVRRGLASAFLLLYTKLKTSGLRPNMRNVLETDGSPATVIGHRLLTKVIGLCLVLIIGSRLYLPWAAIGLFHKSHREAYYDIDVKITYAILCCTTVLEAYSIISVGYTYMEDMSTSTESTPSFIISSQKWPEMVAQYSLIGYFARNKNYGKLISIASYLGFRDLVDRHWSMDSCSSSRRITELVLRYLRDGWKEKIEDVASYRSFIDYRGQWALEGHENELGWSIRTPFDESVLLWHIATDLCCFSWLFSEQRRRRDLNLQMPTKAVQCRQMSNYMVHLLFVNPEMLLPGTRRNLFKAAYDDLKLKDILVGDEDDNLDPQRCCPCKQVEEKDLMERLIKKMQGKTNKQDNSSEEESKQPNGENFIDDAWDLAQGLLKLRDDLGEEKMWEVIQRVWVEMLCFSASRCRGYLHAKALGSGGEFLSYVWLLMFYMGMETFTERLERGREVLPSHEGNNSAAPAPRASDVHNGSGIASSSASCRIRNRAAPSPSHLNTDASSSGDSEISIKVD